jgi:RNA polymerase sigma factor (sigma-70 family)
MTAKKPTASAGFVTSVFKAYGSELHGFLVRRLRRNQDASDVAQEVYLRLLRLERSDLVRQPHAYVYFVASQVVADFQMRASQHPVLYDSEAAERSAQHAVDPGADEISERLDMEAELKRLLRKLSATHRNVLLLRKRDGLSLDEIGQQLGFSVHTVKKYLCQANAQILSFKRKQL